MSFFHLLSQSPAILCEQKGCSAAWLSKATRFSGLLLKIFFCQPWVLLRCQAGSQQEKENRVSEGKCVAALQGGLKCELILNGWTGSTSMSVFQSEGKTLEGKPRSKLSSFLVASA